MINFFKIYTSKSVFCCICMYVLFNIFSCKNKNNNDNATQSNIEGIAKVIADESYQLIMQSEIEVFEGLNTLAAVQYQTENVPKAIQYLLNDSCKVIVIHRPLNKNETQIFNNKNIYPNTNCIGQDAIAIIVNPKSNDTLMSIEQLKQILLGKINKKLVFDAVNSSNFEYLKDSFLNGSIFGQNCFALKSNYEVLDYISKNENAIGIIGISWITDNYNSIADAFTKKIKVVALSKNESQKFVKPYQAYIYTKEYPLIRHIYAINTQTRVGIGMGFVNFLCSEQGQMLIKKSGLIPVMPIVKSHEREVQLNTKIRQ